MGRSGAVIHMHFIMPCGVVATHCVDFMKYHVKTMLMIVSSSRLRGSGIRESVGGVIPNR